MPLEYARQVKDAWKAIFNEADNKTGLGITNDAIENTEQRPPSTKCPLVAVNYIEGEPKFEEGDADKPEKITHRARISFRFFVYDSDKSTQHNSIVEMLDKAERIILFRYGCNGLCRETIVESKLPMTTRWTNMMEGEITAECLDDTEEQIPTDDDSFTL